MAESGTQFHGKNLQFNLFKFLACKDNPQTYEPSRTDASLNVQRP